jgi:hypothetical protein
MSEIKPIEIQKPVVWQATFKDQREFMEWICGKPFDNFPKAKKVNILK